MGGKTFYLTLKKKSNNTYWFIHLLSTYIIESVIVFSKISYNINLSSRGINSEI